MVIEKNKENAYLFVRFRDSPSYQVRTCVILSVLYISVFIFIGEVWIYISIFCDYLSYRIFVYPLNGKRH